ncbi:unnamed protein product [Peronospora belbahrii]|uniref:Uncharacterized protein n=1 Tax=Peronospora belbahrii TaxID=622444 RepID=A0ABN8D598_9STRA|nr:unnamed protein product [Peronospora belbahrii]
MSMQKIESNEYGLQYCRLAVKATNNRKSRLYPCTCLQPRSRNKCACRGLGNERPKFAFNEASTTLSTKQRICLIARGSKETAGSSQSIYVS